MNFTQLEEIRVMLEARICMSLIVLAILFFVIHAAKHLHEQSAWWQPIVKQRDFDQIEKTLNLLVMRQGRLAKWTAAGMLLVVWTSGLLLLLSSCLTLALLVCSALLWRHRIRTWHAAHMVKDLPHRDTQVG